MAEKRPHTRDFPAEARTRLGVAATRAREALGHQFRPSFAKLAKISVRSIVKLESGEPVGPPVYEAVARVLPNWTEETPRAILEGGPIPANEPAVELVPAPDGHWPTDAEIVAMTTRDMARFSIKIEDKSGWQAAEDWLFHALTVRRDAKRNLAVPQSG